MADKRYIGSQELNQRVNYNDPYTYVVQSTLTSNSDSTSAEFIVGNEDFWCADLLVTALDSAGKNVTNDSVLDNVVFTIKDEDGHDFVHSKGFPISAIQQIVHTPRFKGWVLERKQKVIVNIWATTFPQTAKMTYPLSIQLTFLGYRMLNTQN